MWITSTHGYFSAVIDGQIKGNMLLRFRLPEHAHAIRKKVGGNTIKVRETPPPADYRWKFSISRKRFTALLVKLAEELDYDNFKGACHHTPEMAHLSGALHKAWAVWNEEQHRHVDRLREKERREQEGERDLPLQWEPSRSSGRGAARSSYYW